VVQNDKGKQIEVPEVKNPVVLTDQHGERDDAAKRKEVKPVSSSNCRYNLFHTQVIKCDTATQTEDQVEDLVLEHR